MGDPRFKQSFEAYGKAARLQGLSQRLNPALGWFKVR